jgi:hypothetical protein
MIPNFQQFNVWGWKKNQLTKRKKKAKLGKVIMPRELDHVNEITQLKQII